MGIGAYTSALMTKNGFPFFPSLAAGMLLAGIAGFLLVYPASGCGMIFLL